MNKRLEQFLIAENISQAQFADKVGVARASVSHILSGRNKPGFDFIERIARSYPALSLEWLINGKGKMYKDQLPPAVSLPLHSTLATAPPEVEAHIEQDTGTLFDEEFTSRDTLSNESPFRPSAAPAPAQMVFKSGRKNKGDGDSKISRIIVLYSDGTYQELK